MTQSPNNRLVFADGELITTFHDRPEQSLFVVDREAIALFAALRREELNYAISPARGDYFGFAALHDKCDANMLLPGTGNVEGEPNLFEWNDDEASVAAVLAFHTAVMDKVNELFRAMVAKMRPMDLRAGVVEEVLVEACKFPLLTERKATRGGWGYVVRNIDDKRAMVLLAADGDGGPWTLDEEATVLLTDNEEWVTGLEFHFERADAAIAFMGAFTHTENLQ